jgi:hypothetical protein
MNKGGSIMRRLLLIPCTAVLAVLLVAAPVLAAPPQAFHLEKACPSPTFGDNACDVIAATGPFSVLVGGAIVYFDHMYDPGNPAGYSFEAATIHLVDAANVTLAIGHIHWRMTPDGTFLGVYTLGGGSGSLAGIHATGNVTFTGEDGSGRPVFSLDGTYHVGS